MVYDKLRFKDIPKHLRPLVFFYLFKRIILFLLLPLLFFYLQFAYFFNQASKTFPGVVQESASSVALDFLASMFSLNSKFAPLKGMFFLYVSAFFISLYYAYKNALYRAKFNTSYDKVLLESNANKQSEYFQSKQYKKDMERVPYLLFGLFVIFSFFVLYKFKSAGFDFEDVFLNAGLFGVGFSLFMLSAYYITQKDS